MGAEPARTGKGTHTPEEARSGAESREEEGPVGVPGGRTSPVELDRLIHGRVRLGIASALAVNESLSFNELKELLDTSDGNLSVHARRLEEAGYLVCTKSFEGRIPHTEYRLTDAGRGALETYIDHMEALIEQVRES